MKDIEALKGPLIEKLFKTAALPLKLTPLWLDAMAFGTFVTEVIKRNPDLSERLREIDGRRFLFKAKDVEKGFYLLIEDGGIKVMPHMQEKPDVIMRGSVKVLMDLFLGKEDADTVFFSRELEIEGDTAVALHFKNILSSL